MTTKNNIPAGYKDSAVGIIPQEWEVKRLGACFSIGHGRDYKHLSNGDIPVYGSGGIICYVGSFLHDGETVCIGRKGTINKPFYYNGPIWTVDTLFYTHSFQSVLPRYVGYLFDSIDWMRYNEATGVPSLTAKTISNIKKAVPPIAEQRKIAEILGVWDEVIEKQSRLIEKLELRKRALMQRLLTGRTRLPGFTTSWQKVKLGEIGKFVSGCVFNENEQGGKVGFPFFKVSDMNLCGNEVRMTKSNNYVTQEQIERLNYIVVKDEAIIFAKVGAAIALERKRYAKDFIIDNNMLAYVPDTNIWYMKYWFDSIKLSKYIQVGALPSYNASDLAIIKLNLPSSPEQKAIAEVLTTADDEIATHRKKLDALRLQKRGLMQQLLTGKTRVKI